MRRVIMQAFTVAGMAALAMLWSPRAAAPAQTCSYCVTGGQCTVEFIEERHGYADGCDQRLALSDAARPRFVNGNCG